MKGTIVDVRTPEEFEEGNVDGSVNIPLQELPERIDELDGFEKPIVLCCASGNRSGMAETFLKNNGYPEVKNGGGWRDVYKMVYQQ